MWPLGAHLGVGTARFFSEVCEAHFCCGFCYAILLGKLTKLRSEIAVCAEKINEHYRRLDTPSLSATKQDCTVAEV